MPSEYTRVLKLPLRVPLGGNMYDSVMDLALSYHLNYQMVFPSVNDLAFLIEYARWMSLPGLYPVFPSEVHPN